MKEPPAATRPELIERFGRLLAENFNSTLRQLKRSLVESQNQTDMEFRQYLDQFPPVEREMKIAESALETFIHDFMACFDESDDFKIVGTLKDGTQFDIRDLCPEGLHGNQLDWLENYASHKGIYQTIFEKRFRDGQ